MSYKFISKDVEIDRRKSAFLSWINLSFQSKFTLAPNLIQMIRARFMALAQILQSQKMAHQKLMRTQKMIALKTSKFRRRNFI